MGRRAGLRGLMAALALAVVAAGVAQDRTGPGTGPDDYGYVALDQGAAGCPYQFVDISASGTPVTFTASGGEPAADDGGAVVALAAAFELYGQTVTSLVMSSNGYLAAASSLAEEDGGDFSNDCPMPAVPGNDAGVAARLMVCHDDLSGAGSGGAAVVEHFASCPRPSDALADEACSVFQWTSWGFDASGDVFDLQAVLYHSSFEIVFQVAAGDSSGGASATVGIQNHAATDALIYSCDAAGMVPGGTAVCLFDPRFPPGGPVGDLSVAVLNRDDVAVPGGVLAYTIEVANDGPSAVAGAAVADAFPAELDCTWSCEAAPGSSCTAGPVVGDLVDAIDLAPGGVVSYAADCAIDPGATGVLVNTVTVAAPAGVTDPDVADNAATDTTPLQAGAELAATKTAAGDLFPGGTVIYTVTLTNVSAGDQADNPGDELVDVLPAELALVDALVVSGGGVVSLDLGAGSVAWNGALAAGGEVVLSIEALIGAVPPGTPVVNQAEITYDSDGDGTNDAQGLSDDPDVPGAGDPTGFVVGAAGAPIPLLSGWGLAVLVLLVCAAGLVALRRL